MRLLAEIALVVLAAVGIAVCLAQLPRPPAPRERSRPPQPPRPDQLVALERLVSMAGTSALQVHAYLRPQLAEIASRKLAARGRSLERIPAAEGRALLGDHLWDLVRPDRPFPEDRHGPGIPAEQLRQMLETLEQL